jgi:signal transduction histidine kinase
MVDDTTLGNDPRRPGSMAGPRTPPEWPDRRWPPHVAAVVLMDAAQAIVGATDPAARTLGYTDRHEFLRRVSDAGDLFTSRRLLAELPGIAQGGPGLDAQGIYLRGSDGRSRRRQVSIQGLAGGVMTLLIHPRNVVRSDMPGRSVVQRGDGEVSAWALWALAHDVRTPLAAIGAFAAVLAHPGVALEEVGGIATRIGSAVDSVERLLRNIMDLERSRHDGIGVQPEWVDAAAIVANAISLIDTHGTRVVFEPRPVIAAIDPFVLERIVENLVTNAARHAGEGPVTVTLEGWEQRLLLTVGDRGPGLTDTEKERVFLPFVRGQAGVGTGLGLALVRAFAEAHGGTVTVEDRDPLPGSVFTVEIPSVRSFAVAGPRLAAIDTPVRVSP